MTSNDRDCGEANTLLVQLSDPHLREPAAARLRGVVTLDCLKAVLELAAADLVGAGAIMVTGDISDDGSAESYRVMGELLQHQRGTRRLLHGNHDLPEELNRQWPQPPWPTVDTLGAWQLIGLSSHLPGEEGGHLDAVQLNNLNQLLGDTRDCWTVIALHHPPVATGSPWLDRMGLDNHEAFRGLLQAHPQVRAVIFGHAHQEIDRWEHGVRWLGCPATCIQFRPDSDKPFSDTRLPGYRWLRLHSDGQLQTGVKRLLAWPPGSEPNKLCDG